jgi:predicted GNAT family acetyltransferase
VRLLEIVDGEGAERKHGGVEHDAECDDVPVRGAERVQALEFELVGLFRNPEIEAALRGQGLGRRLAGEAVLTLSRGTAAVIASPAPYGGFEDPDQRFRDVTKATRFLAPLGFEPFRNGLWILDTSLEAPLEALRAVRYGE